MRVVLDANVLLSGLVTGTSTPQRIVQLWSDDQFDLVASDHILDGVERALLKPYWQRRLDLTQIQDRLTRLRRIVDVVSPTDDVHGVAEDDEDDLVLATAVAAEADYLVTGDKYLLDIEEFRGIRIVSPRAFLDEVAGTA